MDLPFLSFSLSVCVCQRCWFEVVGCVYTRLLWSLCGFSFCLTKLFRIQSTNFRTNTHKGKVAGAEAAATSNSINRSGIKLGIANTTEGTHTQTLTTIPTTSFVFHKWIARIFCIHAFSCNLHAAHTIYTRFRDEDEIEDTHRMSDIYSIWYFQIETAADIQTHWHMVQLCAMRYAACWSKSALLILDWKNHRERKREGAKLSCVSEWDNACAIESATGIFIFGIFQLECSRLSWVAFLFASQVDYCVDNEWMGNWEANENQTPPPPPSPPVLNALNCLHRIVFQLSDEKNRAFLVVLLSFHEYFFF